MYLSDVHACASHTHRANTSLVVRANCDSCHKPSYHWRNRTGSECETSADADRLIPNRESQCGMNPSAYGFSPGAKIASLSSPGFDAGRARGGKQAVIYQQHMRSVMSRK